MTTRIEMNTTSLQKAFPEIYKEFFSRNDLVVSACFPLPWGYEGGVHQSHQVIIKSKIPLKCFVGIKKIKKPGTSFKDAYFYNSNLSSFEKVAYEKVNKEEKSVARQVQKFLEQNGISEGVEITFFSEIARGHSFGFSDTSSAVLALGLYILAGKITPEIIADGDGFSGHPIHETIIRFAWQLSLTQRYGNTISQGIRSAFFQGSDITVTYCEEFSKDISPDQAHNIFCTQESVSKKFADSIVTDELPLDYGMIFSGIASDSKQVEKFKQAEVNGFENTQHFLGDDLLAGNIKENIYAKRFLERKDSIYTQIADLLTFLNIRSIEIMKGLLEKGYDMPLIREFIENINHERHVLAIPSGTNNFSQEFIIRFKNHQKNSDELLGITPIYTGKLGGGFLFVMPQGVCRETFMKTMEDMRALYPNIGLDYCSFLDGSTEDGLCVEQYLSGGIFSDHIRQDRYLYVDNLGESYAALYREIMDGEQKGILLDTVEKKIYFDGQKLTSKDIPSQNATLDVLNYLFDHMYEDVPGTRFPASSYSKSKNEMLGKVILPFVKFIEEKTGFPFPMSCKGGLTEFYLRLEKTPVKIGIIRQLWK